MPCCHSCTLAQQLLGVLWGRKHALTYIVLSRICEKEHQPGCRSCALLHFSCPFYKFEAAPLHFFGVQDENLFVSKRDCRRMDAQGCDHCMCVPSTAAPSSCRSPVPCFPSGCRFAHIKNSSGRVCTCITLQ